jgi:hypothetical protein
MGEHSKRQESASLKEIEEHLRSLGVGSLVPGFYDDPAFVAAEVVCPTLLEEYAEYVNARSYSPEYLARARSIVLESCEFLFRRLSKDGRMGACVDVSMVLSRMLERLGLWNYMVRGCLTVKFNNRTRHGSRHFALISRQQNRAAPHAWVVVPPFRVVDVTISLQPFDIDERELLPAYVAAENVGNSNADIVDWFDPNFLSELTTVRRRAVTLEDVRAFGYSHAIRNSQRFGVYEVYAEQAVLKYITADITASDKRLEGIRSLCLTGDYPPALFRQLAERLEKL